MGGAKKKIGRRRKRTVGRPAAGFTIDGDLMHKTFAQVQHESGTAHCVRAAGLTDKWEEYTGMLQQRGLYLYDKKTTKGCPAAKFPSARALPCTKTKWMECFHTDGAWLREHLWVSGRHSKVHKRGFVHLGHRYFRGEFKPAEHPQLIMWVLFWRNPLLKVVYSYGLGVKATRDIPLEDGEQKVLAYGLPDSHDGERYKGLTVDFHDGSPRSVFGPFALFNGACKEHANCGIFILKKNSPFFPAWLDPAAYLAVIMLVKPVKAGEELVADYQLDDDDECTECQVD
jgi:hypothetical protein